MSDNQMVEEMQSVNPVEYVKPHLSSLDQKDRSILIGSILLLEKIPIKLFESILNLRTIEVEEQLGRLLQSDFLDGEFRGDVFVLEKINYTIQKQHPNLTLDDRILLAYIKARFSITFEELQKAFSLTYQAVIYILSGFISQGLISTIAVGTDKIEVIVHYTLPTKPTNEITEVEKQIVGYAILKQITSFHNITVDLNIPEHKVQSTVINMILSDLILCNFEVKKNFLQRFELLIEIKRFLILFPARTIDMMSENERMLIGLILLRRKVRIEQLRKTLNIPEATILRTIATLTSTREFEFLLSENQTVQALTPLVFQQNNSIERLDASSLFNYRVLLGIISTEKKLTLRQIQKKMNAKQSDIIRGMIELFMAGLMTGYFKNENQFILEGLQQSRSTSEVTFERWERILLGALISEKVISWPKIAALLEIDRSKAGEKAYSFISRGITNTQARDSVLMMNEIPNIPPLIQVDDLEIMDQQILGYIIAKRRVSSKDIRSLFSLSMIEVYRKVYYLCGSGLLIVQSSGNSFVITEPKIPEPSVPISELDPNLQQLVKYIENLSPKPKKYNMRKVGKSLNRNTKEVLRDLGVLISRGYYQGYLKNRAFTMTKELFRIKGKPKCFSCTNELIDYKKRCPECQSIPPVCTVCTGALSSNDFLVSCPHCEYKAHTTHLLEWLKIRGQCPVCRNGISPKDLLRHDPI